MVVASILIVDDHPLFAGGFVHMTRTLRPNWRLHSAASAAQAMAVLRQVTTDLAIVDISLPDINGFALLERLTLEVPAMKVVLISGRDDAAVRVRARAAGAWGFVAKTEMPEVIVAGIDTVLNGGRLFAGGACGLPVLTPRQAEVLALLAEGHANKEIRHRLGIAERTVRAHLTELFHMLGASSRMQAVIRGRELGLIE